MWPPLRIAAMYRWMKQARSKLGRAWRRRVNPLRTFRSSTPLSRNWGFDRGQAIDRYYIEQFLSLNATDIRGRVLEVHDNSYATWFGRDRVLNSDVLDIDTNNAAATIVADLSRPQDLPSDAFDCFICTQTLLLIYDLRASVQGIQQLLKPGGVALVTVPGISKLCTENDVAGGNDYWRFTSHSLRRLFGEFFPPANLQVKAYGNLLAATAFLHGASVEEFEPEELEPFDPEYEVTIACRAVKPMHDE